MLRVSGKRIVDDFGQEVVLRGFNFWDNDVFYAGATMFTHITLEDLQRIKAWGFNTVKVMFCWTYHIEPDEAQPGVYDEVNLARIEQLIQDCQTAGLYIIIASQVSFGPAMPYWAGWSTHDYVLFNQLDSAGVGGLDRYTQFWNMMVQRFDKYDSVIGYTLWNYPLHALDATQDRSDAYYNIVVPRLISTVRAKSNKIIFFSPIHKGTRGFWDESYGSYVYEDTYWYGNDPNLIVRKIPYDVVYMFDNYGGMNRDVVHAEREWNYDMSRVEQNLIGGKTFQDKYNVPFMADEGGMMRPHSTSQLDLAKAILNLRETFPKNWLWNEYSGPADDWGIYEDRDKTVEGPLIPILQEYTPPTPKPLFPRIHDMLTQFPRIAELLRCFDY